ncbi:MAG TPA: efflux RND transporter permease subunit [Kofleriaceae bacterium]|jgi:multidrug efflux pump subunit AcrB
MWIVRLALRRPYTFVVMAVLIALGGVYSIEKTPTDIFPSIDIPVISVIWNYGGLPPEDMEKRITNNFERFLTTIVADVDHVESQTITGNAIIKIYMQPGADVSQAIAQTTAIAQTAVRSMPPGTVPPLIMKYSASSVPIMMLALESDTLSETQVFDDGYQFLRADFSVIPGTEIPYPYGGKQREVLIDIDSNRMHALGISPRDVNAALGNQNIILPSGTAKLGTNEYPIIMSATPRTVAEIGDLPIKAVGDRTVYIRDVANVRDGEIPQTNMVHKDGHRSVLMVILKNGDASTLDVVKAVREHLPGALERLPKEAQGHITAKVLFDQSVFVRASIDNVLHEAIVAALLTGLMILLFIGSWRSTLVVIVSIPLSILFAIIALHFLGETLNAMTLGGLALAVGVLVDDATVEIENINRNRHLDPDHKLVRSILRGAEQVATPAFVSTLCICIVFAPISFLTGASKSLFVPLGLSVVFAMLMSYALSRTVVPTMVRYLLERESNTHSRFTVAFDRAFDRLRTRYGQFLAWSLLHRRFTVGLFAFFVVGSFALFPFLGRDFFPTVDAGLIKLHVRTTPGLRIEETEKQVLSMERVIRSIIPPDEIDTMIDIIGTPYSSINLSLSEGALISPSNAQILIALKPGHKPTDSYMRGIRKTLFPAYPDTDFFFLAPDISTQVLNFGLAAPIDLQVVGPIGSEETTQTFAEQLATRVRKVPGAADVHFAQESRVPELKIEINRTMAQQSGLAEKDVANDVLVSLSSSGQVAPSFWIDPRGVQYLVAVQTPQYDIDSVDALRATPVSTSSGTTQTLGNLATISRTQGVANITHFNVARTFDVQLNIADSDLGAVADQVDAIVADMLKHAPKGVRIRTKGQAESMESSFGGLRFGLMFAIVLVYLLMVVNFQSWLDPFIILMALPGALAGIVWILFLTGTTLSVPALIGSIMCVGVATSNSILVVSFANDQRAHGRDARAAALASGMTRLRPVIMTALAMIIGMLPMATGLGEGGEQNAPLGRAVIGGLALATVATLVFVPVMYSLLRKQPPRTIEEELK